MSDSTQLRIKEQVVVDAVGLTRDFPTPGGVIRVLRGVDLRVDQKEMIAVMGPSGVGKSTLLFILGLLLSPTCGAYHMLGQDMSGLNRATQARLRRQWLGFVFQGSDMVETGTVYENLELPLIYAEVSRTERPARIADALEQVQMTHRIHHAANLLSGGERQRVAIARALVNRPRLILADEPTGQVDLANTERIMDHLDQIAAEGTAAVIVVTHDPAVAARCSRICRLEDGVLYEQ
jgi:putative ABC transport system ATP-binding protein